jgi:hypothetical protein
MHSCWWQIANTARYTKMDARRFDWLLAGLITGIVKIKFRQADTGAGDD